MLAGTSRKRRRSMTMSSSDDESAQPGPSNSSSLHRAEFNADHGMKLLSGLYHLKRDGILCDVTLIADGTRFEVHKVILVACSDYFRSMFTSGMKETTQREIELKGITARGLEKVLEVIYTSTTALENDDIFDVIGAAIHLQVTPVIEFCERNFLSGMTTSNFFEFINTARLYNMSNALRQIDRFIAQNLQAVAQDGTLHLLTLEQLQTCLNCCPLGRQREIDVFEVVWQWLRHDEPRMAAAAQLMEQIRFPLISPGDLVGRVQAVSAMMTQAELRAMVFGALNYHVLPHAQPLRRTLDTQLRCGRERLICVGGREIHPHPGLHDEILVFQKNLSANSLLGRREIVALPNTLSHMQVVVFNNFLYVLGGCTTQCAHGESAVNSVVRYDPRFNTWLQVAPMVYKRAYFYAGLVNDRIYAVGGKYKEGSLATVEVYDAQNNQWIATSSMPSAYHAHGGAVLNENIYISGGYSNNHFTPDLQRFDTRAGVWEDLAPMLAPRGWHVMCAAKNLLLIIGGCTLNTNQHALPVLQTEAYEPLTDQWTLLSPCPLSHKEASCVLYQSAVYVLGGYNVQTKTGQKMVSRYEVNSDTWETVGALPQSMTGVGYCVVELPLYLLKQETADE